MTPYAAYLSAPSRGDWPDLDLSILDETRRTRCWPGCTISASSSRTGRTSSRPAGRPTAGRSIRRWPHRKTASGNSGKVGNYSINCAVLRCPERSRPKGGEVEGPSFPRQVAYR